MLGESVRVSSTKRFALLRPGDPSPEVLMGSKDDVEDIVGFYSAKRFGLNLFDVPTISVPAMVLRSLLLSSGPYPKRAEFEEWFSLEYTDIRAQHRKTEYTLIVEGEALTSLSDSTRDKVTESFTRLVSEFLRSYQDGNLERATYYSTLTAALVNKVNYFAYRHNANANYRSMIYNFTFVLFLLGGMIAVLTSLLDSVIRN